MRWLLLGAAAAGLLVCLWLFIAVQSRLGWERWVHWILSAQSLATADPRFLYLTGMRWEEVNLTDVDGADSSLVVRSVTGDRATSRYWLSPGTDPPDDALIWWQLERTPLLLYIDPTMSPTLFGPDGIAIQLQLATA